MNQLELVSYRADICLTEHAAAPTATLVLSRSLRLTPVSPNVQGFSRK